MIENDPLAKLHAKCGKWSTYRKEVWCPLTRDSDDAVRPCQLLFRELLSFVSSLKCVDINVSFVQAR